MSLLISVGERMPRWVEEGFVEYNKRLPAPFKLELIEIPPARRPQLSPEKAKADEATRILKVLPARSFLIALDVAGSLWSTEIFSEKLALWKSQGSTLCLIIGGPDGLDDGLLAKANVRWSLSPLTFTHTMARVLVVEQWYRAYTLLTGHPYHRGSS